MDTPGLVAFGAVMLLLIGSFHLVSGVVEFANAAWIANVTYGTFGGYLWLWGLLDVAFAVAAFAAGISLFTGGRFGQVVGLAVAGVSAIRWFFYIPAEPWISLVMIALDVLIIYGLVSHPDYFGSKRQA